MKLKDDPQNNITTGYGGFPQMISTMLQALKGTNEIQPVPEMRQWPRYKYIEENNDRYKI